jgi:outer membrane biosynthesis protein TonB
VDRAPYLANQPEVDHAVAAAVASAPWPRSRLQGSVVLHFVVKADGTVDEETLGVAGAPNQDAASLALGVAPVLRFFPGMKDGQPVPVWTDFTVTLPEPLP